MSDETAIQTKNQALDQIVRVRDTARLKLHLLSADARDRWHELEASLASIERKIARGQDGVKGDVVGRLRELTLGVRELLERQASPVQGLTTKVREVMTRTLSTCSPDEPLTSAARIMWEGDCGAVPVVESNGKLAGMITDRDICMAMYTRGIRLADATVASAMSRGAFSCSPEESLETVLERMATHKIRRVPIMNEAGHLEGIVSFADIVRRVAALDGSKEGADTLLVRTLSAICEPRGAAASSEAAA